MKTPDWIYDPTVSALYIYLVDLVDHDPIARTVGFDASPFIGADLDEDGNVVGVEVIAPYHGVLDLIWQLPVTFTQAQRDVIELAVTMTLNQIRERSAELSSEG